MNSPLTRPVGISIAAVYSCLGAISTMISCAAATLAVQRSDVGFPLFAFALLLAGLSAFQAIAAYGLWTLQSWARTFSWRLYFWSLPLGAVFLTSIIPGNFPSASDKLLNILTMCISGAILVYLSRPSVVSLFDGRRESQTAKALA